MIEIVTSESEGEDRNERQKKEAKSKQKERSKVDKYRLQKYFESLIDPPKPMP